MNSNQTTPPLPLGEQQLQSTQPGHSEFWAAPQHPQWSHFQAPPSLELEYNPWMVPPAGDGSSSDCEQIAFDTNYDFGSQWPGQQHQFQQPQYHLLPPVAQPSSQSVEPNYDPYQPTAGYAWQQPVASPQPPLYYPHPQPQHQHQQQHLHRTLSPQDIRPAKRQRFDDPNLNRQGGPMSSEIADRNPGGGGRRGGQSGGGVHAHWSGGNFGGIQAEARNTVPTSVEPAATLLHGAHGFSINGNPWFASIGTNMGHLTTVNNYGGTHGLENLKEFVSFAALHDSAEQDPDRRCHPGTRENVLKQLRDWFDNPNATDRISWLYGPAGAGKSAIAQAITDEYKERGVAATFFFYRSDAGRNNGNRLFPTIAWQLALSIPPTKKFIVHALDKTPHLPTQAVEVQFEQLVARPFQPTNNIASQMLQPAPVVIIDGVDECSEEHLQRRFLTVIGDAVKDTRIPLRFLIVSRPEALIEETLNKFKDFTVSIDLAKLDGQPRKDSGARDGDTHYAKLAFIEGSTSYRNAAGKPHQGIAPTMAHQRVASHESEVSEG